MDSRDDPFFRELELFRGDLSLPVEGSEVSETESDLFSGFGAAHPFANDANDDATDDNKNDESQQPWPEF